MPYHQFHLILVNRLNRSEKPNYESNSKDVHIWNYFNTLKSSHHYTLNGICTNETERAIVTESRIKSNEKNLSLLLPPQKLNFVLNYANAINLDSQFIETKNIQLPNVTLSHLRKLAPRITGVRSTHCSKWIFKSLYPMDNIHGQHQTHIYN